MKALRDLLRRRTVRFLISGGATAVLFFAASFALMLAGATPLVAATAAYAFAFLAGYLVQRGWTFGARHAHRFAAPRYLLLQAGCALGSGVLAELLAGRFGLPPLAVSLLTTGAAGAVSYVVSSTWVFPDADRTEPAV